MINTVWFGASVSYQAISNKTHWVGRDAGFQDKTTGILAMPDEVDGISKALLKHTIAFNQLQVKDGVFFHSFKQGFKKDSPKAEIDTVKEILNQAGIHLT
ncbi:MAG: hypothetical protein U0003_00365 [Vampirovibrionales bacterium]